MNIVPVTLDEQMKDQLKIKIEDNLMSMVGHECDQGEVSEKKKMQNNFNC